MLATAVVPGQARNDTQRYRFERDLDREAWHLICFAAYVTSVRSYRDLEVWQVAMELVDAIHQMLRLLPVHEIELRRQTWRAAISIPSNIAEGYRRRSRAAYRNHVSIAFGSQAEVETCLEIAQRNHLLSPEAVRGPSELAGRVGAMLNRLMNSLEA